MIANNPRQKAHWPGAEDKRSARFATGSVAGSENQLTNKSGQTMHLLIILLQQLLGMLPGAKQVPQPEVVRKGSPSSNSAEPDAYGRVVPTLDGWMTPFEVSPFIGSRSRAVAAARRIGIAALRACGPTRALGALQI